MQRLHYNIKGMSCAACVAHVERAIRGVLGEQDTFTVSLLTNSVSILPAKDISDQNEITELEKKLAAAVHAAGYELLTDSPTEEKKNSEFQNRLIRLIVSAFFTLCVMYISMGGMMGLPIPPFLQGVGHALPMALTQLILTLPVVILNFKFFRSGMSALLHCAPNMDSLIAIGSGASLVYGLFAIVMIATANGNEQIIHSWLHDLYFESAATILTLVSLGKLLESRAKDKASDAVRSLATLSPKFASVLRDGIELSIPVEEVAQGDTVLIRAGELIPVDGEVLDGFGSADESALTGESMPVEKEIGSEVRAACVLTSGALTIRATGVGENTSLSRIIRLLEDAAASKAPIARIADKVSAVFVPCVMAISCLTLLLWMIFSRNLEQALRSAIAVLVISCPCALGLATPTAITVGIGRAAKSGILFRSAEALEKLCSVQTVVFDKTGTITEGRPAVTAIYTYGKDPYLVLSYAAAVERLSAHPLALAVQAAAEEKKLRLPEVADFESMVGIGAKGSVNGISCFVGKPDAEMRRQIDLAVVSDDTVLCDASDAHDRDFAIVQRKDRELIFSDFSALEKEGKTVVLVTLDGAPAGVIGISDRIRSDSKIAVDALKTAGVTCLMLTGDNSLTAEAVAR